MEMRLLGVLSPRWAWGPTSGLWWGEGLGRAWPPPHPQETPTSQVWARRLMAELLRPNMTAKKELRFFCSLRLLAGEAETLRESSRTHRAPLQDNVQIWQHPDQGPGGLRKSGLRTLPHITGIPTGTHWAANLMNFLSSWALGPGTGQRHSSVATQYCSSLKRRMKRSRLAVVTSRRCWGPST